MESDKKLDLATLIGFTYSEFFQWMGNLVCKR